MKTEIEKGNAIIAAFMGYEFSATVTVYNAGMDYKHSYDIETIYANMEPVLIQYEDKILRQVMGVHENYFDSDNQPDGFKYKVYLAYDKN